MKVVVGIVLHVGCTDRIAHNSRCASWLNGCSAVAVATVVLGVIHIELMPHFMGDIVNVKGSPTGAPDPVTPRAFDEEHTTPSPASPPEFVPKTWPISCLLNRCCYYTP